MRIRNYLFNKTLIFFLFIIINISCLLLLAQKVTKVNNETLPDYQNINVSNDEYTMSNKKYYTINKKSVIQYYSYAATMEMIDNGNAYKYYTVESVNDYSIGDTVNEADEIGTTGGSPVVNEEKGRIMNIETVAEGYKVTILNSSNFIVRAYISQFDYYTIDFSKVDYRNYFVLSDNSLVDLKYLGVDYQYAVQDGKVLIEYEVIDDECVILPGVTGGLRIEYGTLENVFVISREAFKDISYINTRTFIKCTMVGDKKEYGELQLHALFYGGNAAVIEGEGLYDGMQVFEIVS